MANSASFTYFNVELESDIVDELYEFDDAADRCEVPPRPSSRLGFLLDSPPHIFNDSRDHHDSRIPAWKRDIGPTLGTVSAEDMTSDPSAGDELEPSPLIIGSALEVDDFGDSSGSSEDVTDVEPESDCSAYGDSDEEFETLLLPPAQSFSPIVFATPQPMPVSDWTSGRPKFSCLPSPLSPRHTVARSFSFHHTPHRHMYHQHGYSRHALLHLKCFWATREDDWIDPQAQLHDSKAYGGLSILGLGPGPVRGAERTDAPDVSSHLPPLSIHPRRGDLSALRDPYCMHIDRYFVDLPLWTMAKTLWMLDMQIGIAARRRGESSESADESTSLVFDEDDTKSEGESLDTPTSLQFSDDSDTTLVDSDSDSDNSPCRGRPVRDGDSPLWERAESQGIGSSFLPSPDRSPSKGSHKRSRSGRSPYKIQAFPESRSQSSDLTRPPWTTCWYRRWDLLMHLVRHKPEASGGSSSVANPKAQPKFFIGDEDEDMASAESDDEDADDTEDVLIMVNPLYRSFRV